MTATVTACISTKDRYFTTLPLALQAIAAQTVRPKQLVIFDDGEMKDLRGVSPYSHLFGCLMAKGIQWFHLPGGRVGQVRNHQTALDRADTDFVWRLDDDNAPEPRCLEQLLHVMQDPSVGAAAGLVHDPRWLAPRPSFITGRIEDILNPFNLQWYSWSGKPEEVDHLYSTFLYRVDAARKAGGYCLTLSPAGHREETLFSHEIKRAGYRLLITPEALTWHFREGTGGIRTYTDPGFWAKDDEIFARKLRDWGVTPREFKMIVLDNGLGDHFLFKSILPPLLAQNQAKRIIVANCYPEVFSDVEGIVQASIADAWAAFGSLDPWNIYKWCEERAWKRSMAEAFKGLYQVVNTGMQG